MHSTVLGTLLALYEYMPTYVCIIYRNESCYILKYNSHLTKRLKTYSHVFMQGVTLSDNVSSWCVSVEGEKASSLLSVSKGTNPITDAPTT